MHTIRKLDIWDKSIIYSLYGLVCSLFFGNALLSIFSVIFYVLSLPKVLNKKLIVQVIKTKPMLFLFGYYLILSLSTLINSTDLDDFLKTHTLFPFLFFPLAFYYIYTSVDYKSIIKTMILIFVFVAITTFWISFGYGLFRVFFEESNINYTYITYKHLTSLFGVEPIYVSVLYLTALILLNDSAFFDNKRITKLAMVLSLIFAITILSSRTTLLALIAYGIYYFGTKGVISKAKFFASLSIGIILVSILTFSIPTLKNRILYSNKNISSYSGYALRTKLWKNSLEVAKESTLMGLGFKTSQKELQRHYKKVNFRRALKYNFNSHNQYLQSFLDGGIFALLFLLVVLIYPFFFTKNGTFLFFCIMSAIVLFTESFLSRQIGITFFCLFYLVLLVDSMKNNIYSKQKI